MTNFDQSSYAALLFEQEFGNFIWLEQSELSRVLRVSKGLYTLIWIDFPIDASAFVDSMDFITHKYEN